MIKHKRDSHNRIIGRSKDDDIQPPTPMRKRGRPARPKPAKRKRENKLFWVDSSNSDGKKDNDNFELEVSEDDDGRKKNARVKGTAWDRAVELDEKLSPKGLSFIKRMTHSQVVSGFWLGIPSRFGRKYLLDHDVDIELEDEEGEICNTKYKSSNTGLSGGWVGFVNQHDLKVDNVLVFQLVSQTKFKVNECFSRPFAAVRSFLDFKFLVGDGLLVLPDKLRRTYYHLCQARKGFLHKNVLKTISPELTTRLIVETANIAEGIRASSSPPPLEDLVAWKKTLESFEAMGMDVAFICERIDDLLGLLNAPSSTAVVVPEWYEKVKLEQACATKELRDLESTVSILKDTLKKIDVRMEEMVKVSAKKEDHAVRKLATAPW